MAFVNEATIQLQFTFKDRGRHKSTLTFYFPFATPHSDVLATAIEMLDQWAALSDAIVPRYTIRWFWFDNSPASPSDLSDTRSFVELFYRNEDEVDESFRVPSPSSAILQATGDLSGIRVNPSAAAVVPFATDAADTLSGVVTPEGTPFPTSYVVGGYEQ